MPVHRIYSAPSPYNSSELVEMDYEQTADVLYLAHRNHAPTKLLREGHYDWSFETVTFQPTIDAPTGVGGTASTPNTDAANSGDAYFPQEASYVVTAVNEDTGQESRASSAVSLTNDLGLKRNYNSISWSAVTGATYYRIYKSDNTQAYGLIGITQSTSFRDDNIDADISSGPPVADNPFASAGDYPGRISFHEQRSWWGNTINRPNAIWASRSADYENMDFTRPGREDDAFAIGLVANKVNAVNNLVSSKHGMLALTSHNLFTIQGSNEDYITAVPPPRVRPEVSRGASALKPITVDNATFYETAKSGEIRVIGYQFELDGIRSDDVTIFSRHLFENHEIVAWAYAEKPASAIVLIRDDGRALCMTWDQAQQVWGWTIYETDGLFKGVCSITEQDEDRLYFLVERTVDGETKRYVERMASELWQDQEDACYLDCARSFENDEPVATVDRLDHLEGREVVAWVDGQAIRTGPDAQPLTVSSGAITLPVAGTKITVGLPFTATIETLPLAIQTGAGWSVARPQQADRVILRVVNSRNIKAGVNEANLFECKQRETEDYGQPIDLLTGDLDVQIAGTSGNETVVLVKSEDPTPFHVAAILIEPRAGDMS